jgi:hypothetical protein
LSNIAVELTFFYEKFDEKTAILTAAPAGASIWSGGLRLLPRRAQPGQAGLCQGEDHAS